MGIFYAADDALKGYETFTELMRLIDNKDNKSYLEICYKYIDNKKIKTVQSKNKNKIKKSSLLNNSKNFKNKQDALKYNQCSSCKMITNDLIMFSIIPEQYKPFISSIDDKYRIPLCIKSCFKKYKTKQNNFMNEIHQKHDCVMIPNNKLLQ